MAWAYFGILIAAILILFVFVRRPMYEVMLITFVLMAVVTGQTGKLGRYLYEGASNYLLYTIIAFIAFSVILDRTGVVYDLINVVTALVGRFSGGAGYMCILASSLMGALSGSGPGNAAAIGSVSIPTMRRAGFTPELAAVVEMSASALGPVIPPSGSITIVYGILISMYPGCCSFSQYWLMMWGISLWFILQRFISLYIDIRRAKIGPIPREERIPLRQALRQGWKACLLPVVVFLPFFLDAQLQDVLFAARLGEEGARIFSSSLLAMIPSLCVFYVIWVCRTKDQRIRLRELPEFFRTAIKQISPVAGMVLGGFGITALFNDIGVGEALAASVSSMDLPYWVFALIVPLVFAFFGMFLESTTMLYMFSMPFIALAASVGFNPMIAAGMMPVATTAMGHMTPPFAQTFYVSMGLANSDFGKTVRAVIPWCILQYIFEVLVFLKLLPIPGAVSFPF